MKRKIKTIRGHIRPYKANTAIKYHSNHFAPIAIGTSWTSFRLTGTFCVPLHIFCSIWSIFCSCFYANNKKNNKASFRIDLFQEYKANFGWMNKSTEFRQLEIPCNFKTVFTKIYWCSRDLFLTLSTIKTTSNWKHIHFTVFGCECSIVTPYNSPKVDRNKF